MTSALELGTIENVDIREVWPTEDGHFTPWLGENLDKLGAELGLELELVQTEAPVGVYSLDILATDVGSDGPVVIENQFGNTDHDHLGKLLTYAAGFDAYAIVWISEKFRDEHREALDLLNRRTDEETVFFGMEIELQRIDSSRPAPKFNIVVAPNDWRKQNLSRRQGSNTTERRERYRSFFQGLIDELREAGFTYRSSAQASNSSDFASNVSGVRYITHFQEFGTVRVAVYIDRSNAGWNKHLFDRLKEKSAALESELKEPLEWNYEDWRRSCAIQVTRPGSIDDDEGTLDEVHQWMAERLLKFKEVFGPRLAELVDGLELHLEAGN